jgi:protein subunit release factor B
MSGARQVRSSRVAKAKGLSDKMRELVLSVTLADCEVHEFSVGGAGGQRRDKKKTGIRIIHPPSGAKGQATEQRSQHQNKKLAWRRMCESPEFKAWIRLRTGEDARAVAAVEQEMWPENIKVEYRKDGQWET